MEMDDSPINDKDGDLEMKQLLNAKLGSDDVKVAITKNDSTAINNSNKKNDGGFTGFSKQELEELEKNEPIWGKVRMFLLIIFCLVWVGLLAGAILVIIYAPKCPPREDLKEWQSGCTYRLNVYSFKDSNNDGVGDFDGVSQKLNYLENDLGVKNVIFDPINTMDANSKSLGLSTNYLAVDPLLGSKESLKSLLKDFKKKLMNAFVVIDFMTLGATHPWFVNNANYFRSEKASYKSFSGASASCKSKNGSFYQVFASGNSDSCVVPMLNLTNPDVLGKAKSVLQFWLKDMAFDGIVLTNAAFFGNGNGSETSFGDYGKGQLFAEEGKDFVKAMRGVCDEVYSDTGKEKFLLLEGGNTGISYDEKKPDPMLRFLDQGMAHGVFASDALFARGNKKQTGSTLTEIDFKSLIEKYGNSKEALRVSLPLADMFHVRYASMESLTASFLLRTFPVIYMGSELTADKKEPKPFSVSAKDTIFQLYPKGKRLLQGSEDLSFLNHAVMQWNSSVLGFTSNKTFAKAYNSEYKPAFALKNNVKLSQAEGSPDTFFDLVKELMQLRKLETLQWGSTELIDGALPSKNVVAFVRSAERFPTIIVILVKKKAAKNEAKGIAMSFANYCAKAKVLLRFPEKSSHLSKGETVKMSSVYVDLSKRNLLLLKC